MIDASSVAAIASSLKAASDVAKTMVGLRDASALQAKTIELQSMILNAQSSAFAAQDERSALIERIRSLEKQVADLEEQAREKQRYSLKDFGSGTFAYTLKPEASAGEPAHHVCANCYKEGHIAILQFRYRNTMSQQAFVCQRCKVEVALGTPVEPRWPSDDERDDGDNWKTT